MSKNGFGRGGGGGGFPVSFSTSNPVTVLSDFLNIEI